MKSTLRPILAIVVFFLLLIGGLVQAPALAGPFSSEEVILYFPDVSFTDELQTGLAFANSVAEGEASVQGAGTATLELYFIDDNGDVVQGANLTNPAMLTVGPGTQIADVLPNIFGQGIIGRTGMVVVESDVISVVGFFLSFDPAVGMIDGADAIVAPIIRQGNSFSFLGGFSAAVILPEVLVGPGSTNRLSVVTLNGGNPASGTLELVRNGQTIETEAINFPRSQFLLSRFSGELGEIFDTPLQVTDYVRASANTGIGGYQAFGGARFTAGRNATPEPFLSNPRINSSYGAQLALTPDINTFLKAVNPTNQTLNLTIEAFPTGNSPAGAAPTGGASASRQVSLLAGRAIQEDLSSFLGLSNFVGWLRLTSDRTGLIANASFGDRNSSFFSSVELQASPQRELVNSHVANGFGFGTGITFLNPFADPVDVQVDVFDPNGNRTGGGMVELNGFAHRPLLLTDIDPSLNTQVNGFVNISATSGIFSFELFFFVPPGTSSVASLSAVPPQRGNGIIEGVVTPISGGGTSAAARFPGVRLTRTYEASAAKGVRLDPEWDFRPGEVIVKMKGEQVTAAEETLFAALDLRVHRLAPERIALLKSGTIEQPGPVRLAELESTPRLKGLRLSTLDVIEELNRLPEVEYAEPNYILKAMGGGLPNDPLFNLQWHYPFASFPQAWQVTKGDPNLVVAVIDTGAKFTHPDLAGRLTGGQFDFIDDPQISADGDGIDSSAEDPGDDPANPTFHGTHVAGTIGAVTNNGIGVAGGNWNSKLMTLRALGVGGGSTFDIQQAALFAAGLPNVSGIVPAQAGGSAPQGSLTAASVINMSLGGKRSCSRFESETLAAVLNQGVSVIAAAGNSNSTADFSPASCPGVVNVVALGPDNQRAPYSNHGPRATVSGPGGNMRSSLFDGILSTFWDNSDNTPIYDFKQGTSMATPHVAAIASLMLSVNPSLNPAQVKAILEDTAVDLGPPGRDDETGFGRVDAFKAVLAASGSAGSEPILFVSTSLLDFGNGLTSQEVVLQNVGGGTLNVSAIDAQTDSGGTWLSTSQTPAGAGLLLGSSASIFVNVNRGSLPDGDYTGRIFVDSNGGNSVIEVRMRVGENTFLDVGDIAVIAIDPRTLTTAAGRVATFDGGYTYRFQLPAGEYNILAGTDEDGDRIICEQADLCGWFPVSNDPLEFQVRTGVEHTGIDFILTPQGGFTTALPGLRQSGFPVPEVMMKPVRVEALFPREIPNQQ